VKSIALPEAFFGLTNSMSNARITAIAVPVKNSRRTHPAFSAIPESAIQFATTKTLAIRKIIPTNPNTMIFRMVKLITYPFQKVNIYHHPR